MSNDVLISIPLFVFMGYLVERANLIEKLFKSLHLALARVPGSLAVATLVHLRHLCHRHRHRRRRGHADGPAGLPGRCCAGLRRAAVGRRHHRRRLPGHPDPALGDADRLWRHGRVSVVQLYAGAFFPGLMLAGLYILYVVILAKLKPELAPPFG
jgi:hypothetical protein